MNNTPTALLLIATGCQHCPSVLQSLCELVKEGKLSSIEVVNIVEDPERARSLNVRSVPWLKLGEFELLGLKSKTEILKWIKKSATPDDMSAYFEELMVSGEISKVHKLIEEQPQQMKTLFKIMADENSGLSARIGVGAIIEQLEGSEILTQNINELAKYCKHKQARVRSDACYYLGLTHHPDAEKYIRPLLKDTNSEVKEIAEEALAELTD